MNIADGILQCAISAIQTRKAFDLIFSSCCGCEELSETHQSTTNYTKHKARPRMTTSRTTVQKQVQRMEHGKPENVFNTKQIPDRTEQNKKTKKIYKIQTHGEPHIPFLFSCSAPCGPGFASY
ncbi:hypothetical protein T4E_5894 [Trichinella pseudospiralis]|uniref:Uncharacterized protein n=1 Tax=Trichinella pseudospiralis TaxID=6337 RepID=A0A0V0Y3D2_TRIPS|nr:hypothetical protein T4E_5894 [Trichinella pseudospiralis]